MSGWEETQLVAFAMRYYAWKCDKEGWICQCPSGASGVVGDHVVLHNVNGTLAKYRTSDLVALRDKIDRRRAV